MPGTEVSQRAVPHWVLVPVIFLEMVLPPEPWPLSHVNSLAPVIFSHTIGAPLGTPFSSLSIGTLHQHAFPYIADTPKILSSSIHLLYSPQSTLEVQTCSMNPNSTRPPCRHSIQPYRIPAVQIVYMSPYSSHHSVGHPNRSHPKVQALQMHPNSIPI